MTAAAIRSAFGGTADLAAHDLALDGADATLFFLRRPDQQRDIADLILRPARENLRGTAAEMLRDCLTGAVCAAVAKEAPDLDTACSLLVNGFAVLVIQGADRAVAFEVKSGEKRTPSPPSVEHTVQGAKDAFTETIAPIPICCAAICARRCCGFGSSPWAAEPHQRHRGVAGGDHAAAPGPAAGAAAAGTDGGELRHTGGGGGGRGRVPRHALPRCGSPSGRTSSPRRC